MLHTNRNIQLKNNRSKCFANNLITCRHDVSEEICKPDSFILVLLQIIFSHCTLTTCVGEKVKLICVHVHRDTHHHHHCNVICVFKYIARSCSGKCRRELALSVSDSSWAHLCVCVCVSNYICCCVCEIVHAWLHVCVQVGGGSHAVLIVTFVYHKHKRQMLWALTLLWVVLYNLTEQEGQ